MKIIAPKYLLAVSLAIGVMATAACSTQRNSKLDISSLWDFNDPEASRGKFEEALASDDLDEGVRLELQTQIARTYSLQAKFEEAHEVLDRVEPQLAPDHSTARIRYLLERGRTCNSAGDKEKARDLFVKAFQESEQTGNDALAIDAAHMVAIAESEFDDRMAWNLRALELAEKAKDEKSRNWIGSLTNNIGWDYFEKSDYDKALEQFKRSREFFEGSGATSKEQIARWSIARTLRSLGFLDEALAIQLALLAEHEAAGTGDGFVFEELGELYLALEEVEKSKPHFAKAHELLSQDTWLKRNEPERLQRLKDLSV